MVRVFVKGDQLFGKIEGPRGRQMTGPKIETGRWYHLKVTQDEQTFSLYLDDQPVGQFDGSGAGTASRLISLGGNPLFRGGPEFTAARFARLRFVDEVSEPEQEQK